jgi:hypothetical protein
MFAMAGMKDEVEDVVRFHVSAVLLVFGGKAEAAVER